MFNQNRVVPPELQQAIERAYLVMLEDPQHNLPPFYRLAIYNCLDTTTEEHDYHARAILELRTVRYALPYWERVWSDNPFVEHLISMSEQVLQGTLHAETAEAKASEEWTRLENMCPGYIESGKIQACCVGEAAIRALYTACGIDSFAGIKIDPKDSEYALDPWCSDAAKWIAIIFDKYPDDEPETYANRHEFWDWWLGKAIPAVWQLTGGSDSRKQ